MIKEIYVPEEYIDTFVDDIKEYGEVTEVNYDSLGYYGPYQVVIKTDDISWARALKDGIVSERAS